MIESAQPINKLSLIVYQKDCNNIFALYNVPFRFSGTESTSTKTVIITAVCVVAGVVVVIVVVAVVVFKLRCKPPSVERTNTFPIRFNYAFVYLFMLFNTGMKLLGECAN